MNSTCFEVRYALRRCLKSPGYVAFCAIAIGIGVGSASSLIGLLYNVALKPAAVEDPDSVVNIYASRAFTSSRSRLTFSIEDYRQLRGQLTTITVLAGWSPARVTIRTNQNTEQVQAEIVTCEFFSLIGAKATIGRVISEQDCSDDADVRVVVARTLWDRLAAAEHGLTVVKVNGTDAEVIGVADQAFKGVFLPNLQPTRIWIALNRRYATLRHIDQEQKWLSLKARLIKGASGDSLRSELAAFYARSTSPSPTECCEVRASRSVLVHESVTFLMRPLVAIIVLLIALTLAVATTNIATLALSRCARRYEANAAMLSIGVPREGLIRSQIVEVCIITALGGLCAHGLLRLLISMSHSIDVTLAPGMPINVDWTFDSVTYWSLGVSVILVFVILAAISALGVPSVSRATVRRVVVSGSVVDWTKQRRLIAFQVAVSLIFAGFAILCDNVARGLVGAPYREHLRHSAFVKFDLTSLPATARPSGADIKQFLDSIRVWPFGESAVFATNLPSESSMNGAAGCSTSAVMVGGRMMGRPVQIIGVAGDMFAALDLKAIRGSLTMSSSLFDAVVSERFARSVCPDTEVLGHRIWLQRLTYDVLDRTPQPFRVVGVVRDLLEPDDGKILPVVYVDYGVSPSATPLLLASARDVKSAASTLREAVERTRPGWPISATGAADELSGDLFGLLSLIVFAATIASATTLWWSSIGLYSAVSYVFSSRTRELAIRFSLGATNMQLWLLLLRTGLRPCVDGATWGMVVVFIATLTPALGRHTSIAHELVLLTSIYVAVILVNAGVAVWSISRSARLDLTHLLRDQ